METPDPQGRSARAGCREMPLVPFGAAVGLRDPSRHRRVGLRYAVHPERVLAAIAAQRATEAERSLCHPSLVEGANHRARELVVLRHETLHIELGERTMLDDRQRR